MPLASPQKQFFRHVILPVIVAVGITALVTALILALSSRRIDEEAVHRQQALMKLVVGQSLAQVGYNQETSTVWDDAVLKVRQPVRDERWLDDNLGTWLATYHGLDEVYILAPSGTPIYAANGERRVDPSAFRMVEAATRGLRDELRGELGQEREQATEGRLLSPGAENFAIVKQRPAIISVKPIVTDTGKIIQAPGEIYFHIAVQYIDQAFVEEVERNYMFDGLRFAWERPGEGDEATLPIEGVGGRRIGYFLWRPFAPGSHVASDVVPALIGALLLVALVAGLLVLRIRRGIVRLIASEAQAQHLAFHDVLTGLPNRARFDDQIEHEIARVKRGAPHFALLYLDLDRFKNVNDSFGHAVGDELIVALAARLRATLRESDTVARLGGDEFAIIQTGLRSPAETEILCMRIVEEVSRPFDIGGAMLHVGISIGIAEAVVDGLDRIELTRRADIALYRAKAAGRGRYVRFTPDMDQGVQQRKAIEAELRQALATGEGLSIVYQPLYHAQTGKMVGVEALARWNHDAGGVIPPATFIPIAEESGLIGKLGKWILSEACRAAAERGLPSISVNVSPVQLRAPDFADDVLRLLSNAGLEPSRLEVEITETCLIENADQYTPNIEKLRRAGVRIALDDFGTGYSSLSHLRHIDVDRVKIDRSFVSSIDRASDGSAIIQAIVDLARATGLQVTAEGVETLDQKSFLSRIGCNELQGFLLGKPVPEEELDKLLESTGA